MVRAHPTVPYFIPFLETDPQLAAMDVELERAVLLRVVECCADSIAV